MGDTMESVLQILNMDMDTMENAQQTQKRLMDMGIMESAQQTPKKLMDMDIMESAQQIQKLMDMDTMVNAQQTQKLMDTDTMESAQQTQKLMGMDIMDMERGQLNHMVMVDTIARDQLSHMDMDYNQVNLLNKPNTMMYNMHLTHCSLFVNMKTKILITTKIKIPFITMQK